MRVAVRLVFFAAVLLLVAAGAWVASSLASWLGGPRWLAILCALALMPGLPLLWERGAVVRRLEAKRKRRVPLPATLALRSVVLTAVFLGLLLSWWPNQTFLALAQRGDWFLDGAAPRWTFLRGWTNRGAEALEGLWRRTQPDPYRQWRTELPRLAEAPRAAPVARTPWPRADEVARQPARGDAPVGEVPQEDAGTTAQRERLCAQLEDGTEVCVEAEEPPARPAPQVPATAAAPVADVGREPLARGTVDGEWTWPMPAQLHPAVAAVGDFQGDVPALAAALSRHSTRGADRLKAIHDWIADHVAYDAEGYRLRQYGGQHPSAVLASRKAVCAGYAALFEALGKAAGEEVVTLGGLAVALDGLAPHAWSAARVNGGWVLVDVTWNAGYVRRGEGAWTFVKRYHTDYLFTPPEAFIQSHMPDDASWQLLARPRSVADVVAQPRFRPRFALTGLELLQPTARVTEVHTSSYEVRLLNPQRQTVWVQICRDQVCTPCDGSGTEATRLVCPVAARGDWDLHLMSSLDRNGASVESVAMATLQARF